LYWSLPTEKSVRAPVVSDWLKVLLCRTANKAPAGGDWLVHILRVGATCASLAVGASLMQIMHYGLRKSLPAVQRYVEHFDAISPDASAWLFSDWMTPPATLPRTSTFVNSQDALVLRQAPLPSVSSPVDLCDAMETLLEIDN